MIKPSLRNLWIMIIIAILIMTIISLGIGLVTHTSSEALLEAMLIIDGIAIISVFIGWLIVSLLGSRLKSHYEGYSAETMLSDLKQSNSTKEMYVEYELNTDDIGAFKIYNFENSPKTGPGWKIIRRSAIAASIVYLILAIVLYVAFGKEFFLIEVIFIVLALLTITWYVIAPLRIRRNLKRTASGNYNQPNRLIGKHKFSITAEAITDVGDNGETTTHWNAVEYVLSNDQYLFMLEHGSGQYIIPRRAFSDEAAFNDFVILAKTYHKASQLTKKIEIKHTAIL